MRQIPFWTQRWLQLPVRRFALQAPSPMPPVSPPDGPRAITDADFPQTGSQDAQLTAMLNWAVLAPSVMNTQPWRFRVVGSAPDSARAELYVDRARQLVRVDPDAREAVISCGAALFTLRIAAQHYGFATVVTYAGPEDDPDLIATLRLAGPSRASAAEEALFRAIKARHTNRDPYADLDLPAGLIAAIQEAAAQEGAHLHILTGDAEKGTLADLIAEAIRSQGEDEATVNELRAWLRPVGDRRSDGVPDDVQGGWDRLSYLHTDARSLAAAARRLALAAPALLVLTTERDTRHDWVRSGQALQRVLLLAASHGLAASYFNQPTEIPALRQQVSTLAGRDHVQLVFRLGTPIEADGTPRRDVSAVLKPDDYVA
ncbi:MAG: nitroreductase family protein [Rubricoccaceae bacterium]